MTRKRTLHLTARHTETECILTEILSDDPNHSANDYHQRRPVEPTLPKISRIIKHTNHVQQKYRRGEA